MAYALIFGPCIVCSAPFAFNPHAVPSVRVNGVREPICRNCIEEINLKRTLLKVPPFEINPDAYEPIDENEL